MNITLSSQPLRLTLHGFSGVSADDDVALAFQLSGRMWKVVNEQKIPHHGKNIWVYEDGHHVFAGVELISPASTTDLEQKTIELPAYAYFKHVGPYSQIKQTGRQMTNELTRQGKKVVLPYIEIYGHWNKDESKLETELFMCVA